MKIDFVPYEPAHAVEIMEGNLTEPGRKISDFVDFATWAENWQAGGPAETMMVDSFPVACYGLIIHPWKKAEAWALFSREVPKYKIALFRRVKTRMARYCREEGIRRVEAVAAPKFMKGREFLESLGFKLETPNGMPGYGPNGETFMLYGRT